MPLSNLHAASQTRITHNVTTKATLALESGVKGHFVPIWPAEGVLANWIKSLPLNWQLAYLKEDKWATMVILPRPIGSLKKKQATWLWQKDGRRSCSFNWSSWIFDHLKMELNHGLTAISRGWWCSCLQDYRTTPYSMYVAEYLHVSPWLICTCQLLCISSDCLEAAQQSQQHAGLCAVCRWLRLSSPAQEEAALRSQKE